MNLTVEKTVLGKQSRAEAALDKERKNPCPVHTAHVGVRSKSRREGRGEEEKQGEWEQEKGGQFKEY